METRVETTVAAMVVIMVETMTTITNPKHQRIDALFTARQQRPVRR